jgi:hypothetical protein
MNVKRFRDSVATLVRDMQDRGKRNDVTFHVFCGLAGGTGSGAIVDVIAQLRALFPDKAQRILVSPAFPISTRLPTGTPETITPMPMRPCSN